MSIFTDAFGPNDLTPSQFKEFTLTVMRGFYVDLDQPGHWSRIARENGEGVRHATISREIVPIVEAYGATLTPKLASKIVATFLIHGPVLAEELRFKKAA